MQSRLLACVACGGVLAGVVQCRLLDYWWWTTDYCCSMEQSIGKLGVEQAEGQVLLFWKVNYLGYIYFLQSTFSKLTVRLGCSFVLK